MAIPTPGEGRQGLLSFRLFGFPVSIHTSFVVIVLLFGFTGPNPDPASAVVWLLVVTVSVVAHELGHAFVARPAGGDPRIDLYMIAGLTTWQPDRAGRGRRIAVSVAGPATGVLFGVALIAVYAAVNPPGGTLLDQALGAAVDINLGWGLLNLLPMLPLDGGQIVLALTPGKDELDRIRRASYVSLVVAVAVIVGAIAVNRPEGAILVLFFGAGNLQRIVALRRGADPAAHVILAAERALQDNQPDEVLRLLGSEVPEPYRVHAAVVRAAALLRLDRAREAQHELVDLPRGVLDPVFEATVLLANGQEQLARERLRPALAREPAAWAVRELVLLLRARGDDLVPYVGEVTGDAALGIVDALWLTGDYEASAGWGERALATGAREPSVAYNTACAYVRTGDLDRAVRALGYAAELGWPDVDTADADADIAPLRERPEWPAIRERMAANPGLGTSYTAR